MKKEVTDIIDGKTVLVTGGAGAIGSNLTQILADLGTKKVVVLDDLSSSFKWNIPKNPKKILKCPIFF